MEAVNAYQRVQARLKGKRTFYAAYTWRMIENHGIIPAMERLVTRKDESAGYRALIEMGMEDMAFEAVVLRHQETFSAEAVAASKERLEALRQAASE